jgi:hypothetical protein
MSQSPHWIARQAMPMACPAEAQALEVVKEVPRKPCSIDTWPATALAMILGMKCGEMRRGPFSSNCTNCSSMPVMPPMPVAMIEPQRSRSASLSVFGSRPASPRASFEATSAHWVKGSSLRRSGTEKCGVGSKRTLPAKWTV